jgi:O-antigen/teichoic acid export membrane protein/2-polyprenyl-3-methyl-5-hydroxy-6-metoxy-1,4-benzoquinol methylase
MLAQNILTTFGSRVVIMVLALGSSVVLARYLGPDGRGLFAFALLLPDLAKMFGLLGVEQANVVYAGLEPRKRNFLAWHSAIIATAVGCAVAVAGIAFITIGAPGFPTLIRGPLWIYWIPLSIVPVALASEYLGAILRGMNRIFLVNLLDVGTKLGSFILVCFLVGWFQLDVPGAVWADFATNVVTLTVTVALLINVGVLAAPAFDSSLFRRSAKFALPAHCSTVISYLNYRIDQFFIAAWLPPEQLGYYVISVGLAERLWVPTGAIANALLPHITNSAERDPALPAILARHVMIWVGIACLVVFVLGDVLIGVLYSAEFLPAGEPLRWLLPGIFALSVGRVLVAELLAREKPKYTVWGSATATLINIGGNLMLVPSMGITGCAIASSVSYSVLSLLLIWFYLRETGLPFSVLLPRRNDMLIYRSLLHVPTHYRGFKVNPRKAGDATHRARAATQSGTPEVLENHKITDKPIPGGYVLWLKKTHDFFRQPHFPFFLLIPIRRISPTLGRYLHYGRYNPNTEKYWNERYRSGSYQAEEGWRYQNLDREILKLVPHGSKVLDAGCGTGRIMEKLREQRDCRCVGIDISDVAVREVRGKGFRGFKCALPKLASEIKASRFDVCTIVETLEHLTRPQKSLESLARVLKDGGSLIVSVPDDCMKPAEFDEHVSSFDKQSLCALLGQYCEVDQVVSLEAGGNNHLIVKCRKSSPCDANHPGKPAVLLDCF